MTTELSVALRRARRAAFFYALAWIATPSLFLALVFASEIFPVLHLSTTAKGAEATVVVFLFFAWAAVAVARPVHAFALVRLAERCGEPALHPIVYGLATLIMPWLPGALALKKAVAGLRRVDARLDLSTPVWLANWAAPALVVPGFVFFGIAGALDAGQDRNPPYSVYVLAALFAAYGGSRALGALRLRGLIDELLLRPAVDDLRASHSAPVGGG